MDVIWSPAARPARPAWAEVELAAIAANAATLRERAGDAQLMAVVKADGYGHGLEAAARAALAGGATWLGVSMLSEALYLREALARPARDDAAAAAAAASAQVPDAAASAAPEAAWADAWPQARVLVLGYTPPEQAAAAVAAGLRLACDSLAVAEALAAAAQAQGRPAYVHVKVDTGMGRIGLMPAAVAEFVERLRRLDGIVVEGIFTHLAAAEDADGPYTQGQLAAFRALQAELERLGLSPPVWHAANTAATLHRGGEGYQLVRAGIALYGYQPSPHMTDVTLEPALTWKAQLAHSKVVPAGTAISYGCTYRAPEAIGVGTVPVGYGDGFSRHFSNRGEVLCRGRRLPVIGRVCMDQFMVSLQPLAAAGAAAGAGPGLPAAGEEVVLLGRQGDECISAEELAATLGTIAYEVLCLIGRRVPRLYRWRGAAVGCRNAV